MKHLKTFENFNLGTSVEDDEQEYINNKKMTSAREECCPVCGCDVCECENDGEEERMRQPEPPQEIRLGEGRVNRLLEKKKSKGLPPWLKKGKKKEDKEEKGEKKEDKKPSGKGLTAAQKKLPAGLQKAILSKKK